MRGFRKLVWSVRLNVGVGAVGAPAVYIACNHPFQNPFTQFDAVQTRCLLNVSPNVYEEAVWMVGVVVGFAG